MNVEMPSRRTRSVWKKLAFFHTDNYLKIDNTNLPAAEVAAIIESRFRV
jgi:hypothetical protein